MIRKRLQNRVAESRFAFPVAVVYAAVVWMMAGLVGSSLYLQLGIFAVSTLMMVALNNTNTLIRIYSRMVSCSFIAMTCAATFLFRNTEAVAVQMLFVLFYISLLRSYQDKRAPGVVFYSFACIGAASVFFVQILYFVPFFWLMMGANLMALNNRMFWASIIGIIAPYWFIAGVYAWQDRIDELIAHFAALAEFQPLGDYSMIDDNRLLTACVIAVPVVIGTFHYLRNSYLDKIRTRMIFEMFITVNILAIAFMALQPQHFDMLLPIVIVNTSCLYAHFAALTKTWITNIVFILMMLAILALTGYNLFM